MKTKTKKVIPTPQPDVIVPPVFSDTPSSTLPAGGRNYLMYGLVGLLVIAAFLIGNLYTKVQLLEKSGGTNTGTGAPAVAGQQPTAGPVAEVKVNDDDPSLGPKNAKVTVVVFEDFQCPYCGAFTGLNEEVVKLMQSRDTSWQPAIPGLKKEYVNTGKVRLVWKDYPFLGEESYFAAQAGRCAQDQGKFWEFHDYLFSHQKGENGGAFSKDNLKKIAAELGLKTADFNSCLDSNKYEKKIKDAQAYGQSVGVNGTPATYVNGKSISGAVSFAQLKETIEAALK